MAQIFRRWPVGSARGNSAANPVRLAAFVWLILLIVLSFNDYLLREQNAPTPRMTPDEFRQNAKEQAKQ